jgi:hypothetical protein
VSETDHVARNRASRERLTSVIARLGERTVVLPDGWTAAALLTHLAFWDRFSTARLEKHLRDGAPMELPSETVTDLVNEAGLAQWTATPLSVAAALVTDAAAAMDRVIERGLG